MRISWRFYNIQTDYTLFDKSFSFNQISLKASLVLTTRFQDLPQASPKKQQSTLKCDGRVHH